MIPGKETTMKITITMNRTETNAIEKFANKYDTCGQYVKLESGHDEYKFATQDTIVDESGCKMDLSINSKFVVEAIKFIDDIFGTLMGTFKSLKLLFIDAANNRFKKFMDSPEESLIKHLMEITKEGESKIYAIYEEMKWVYVGKNTRKRLNINSYTLIEGEDDLKHVPKNAKIIKVQHDNYYEGTMVDIVKWISDLSKAGKRESTEE